MDYERGGHERDDRWAYVALAVLAFAYIVYRYVDASGSWDFGSLRLSLPDLKLGKLGKSLPYMFAPLFAVLSEVFRRRKARAARKDWEGRVRSEGFLRHQEKVKIRLTDGGKGSFQGEVRLTREALYVFDMSWRREPMRLVFSPSTESEPAVMGVTAKSGSRPEFGLVRVLAGAPERFVIEFESMESAAWLADIRRLLEGSTGRRVSTEESPRSSGGGSDDSEDRPVGLMSTLFRNVDRTD